MSLQKIFQMLHFHRKTLVFMLCIGACFFLSIHGVFAAGETTTGSQTALSKEDGEQIVGILNMAMGGISAILGLITSFISIFLYPGWVNGTMFGLQDYLKLIWILISNVIYFIFAGILIVIAFMNIIGKGEGTWELKQAMPKFIVGILIVPFSWFFVQFLLSISAILTVGVLTLPYESFQNEELFGTAMEESEITNTKFCKDIVISITGNFDGAGGKTSNLTESGKDAFSENIRCKSEESKVSIKEIISGEGNGEGVDNNIFGIISVYTYGILRVQELDTISGLDLTTVKGMSDLIFKIIFDLLFVVVYLILMVALFLALLVRGVRLWVYMMLSPAFGLLYFLGKGGEGFGSSEEGTKFSISEFISLAMVPVYASAALAFGLVFILVATEGIKKTSSEEDMDTLKAGGFSISIIGAHADGQEEKSVIAKLIVELFGVAILWIAVMAALGASETTKNVTAPIRQFGSSVGKLVTAAPTYAPILPASLGGSAQGLSTMGSSIQSRVQGIAQDKGSKRAGELFGDQSDVASSLQTVARSIDTTRAQSGGTYFASQAKELLAAMPKESWSKTADVKAFTEGLEKLGFTKEDIAKFSLTSAQEAARTLAPELANRSGGTVREKEYKDILLAGGTVASTPETPANAEAGNTDKIQELREVKIEINGTPTTPDNILTSFGTVKDRTELETNIDAKAGMTPEAKTAILKLYDAIAEGSDGEAD